MEVEFVLRPNDVLGLHQYCLDRRPRAGQSPLQLIWLAIALLGVAAVWFLVSRADRPDFTMPILVSVFIGAVVIVAGGNSTTNGTASSWGGEACPSLQRRLRSRAS
jgi:hypothetical protein